MTATPLKTKRQDRSAIETDEMLIRLALQGNQMAFTAIVQRHEGLMRAIVGRYLDDPEDIREVLQDAFVRAFRALPGFRRECKFSSWLCRIAISVVLNRLKSRQHQEMKRQRNELSLAFHVACPAEGTIKVEKQETHYWLHQAIEHLSARDALMIRLFYLQEQSIEEICRATGFSTSNVKSRLSRARQRLREIIETDYPRELLPAIGQS